MFAALALLGCDKEHTPNVPAEPSAIGFGNVTTRAVDSVNDIRALGEFEVNACVLGPEGYVSLLENEPVKYENGIWNYDNTRYWANDSHFYFLGFVTDSTDPDIKGFDTIIDYSYGIPYVNYAIDVETDNGDDDLLMAFTHVDTRKEAFKNANPKPAVLMQFGHMLSKINIKIKQDFDKDPNNDYLVYKVSLINVVDKSKLTIYPIVEDEVSYQYQWTTSSKKEFARVFDTPVNLRELGANNAKTIWDESGLMLIPQQPNTIKVQITYGFRYANSTDEPTIKILEGNLPASNQWIAGKSISYMLAISEIHGIKFSAPTIEPWGAPQNSGTIIIK